ncbi:MAG: hypothetical protein HY064_10525 [Bacteroidetes bacterium]|nr:hypothetical protein [Bacteroidota bacterium]
MKHLLRYFIFLVVLSVALFSWNKFFPRYDAGWMSWALLIFLTLVYVFAHLYISAGEKGKPGVFVRRFMGATTLRLMLFLIAILIFTFTRRDKAVLFLFHFLVLYILFTVFEVITFYKQLRKKN